MNLSPIVSSSCENYGRQMMGCIVKFASLIAYLIILSLLTLKSERRKRRKNPSWGVGGMAAIQ